jgi:hypothetical protein
VCCSVAASVAACRRLLQLVGGGTAATAYEPQIVLVLLSLVLKGYGIVQVDESCGGHSCHHHAGISLRLILLLLLLLGIRRCIILALRP